MSLKDRRIGFLGGGAMAEALIGGLLEAGARPDSVCAADPLPARRTYLAERFGVRTASDNREAAASDVVVIAVKPGAVGAVLEELARGDLDRARPLWVSIAAGVTLAAIEARLPPDARIVRAMPNTPARVREGATGLCGNARTTPADRALAVALFEAVGVAWEAPREELLDAVTGLSGSGPAYLFAFLEALIDAGVDVGLPRAASQRLALQTVFGAAKLARDGDATPAELRRQVSSPGGTTLAGLARLEAEGFARAVREAVRAATQRAGEMGRGQ